MNFRRPGKPCISIGPWRNTAKTTHSAFPPPGTGKVWKPAGSHFSYIIVSSTKNEFEIRSTNAEAREDYFISADQHFPMLLKEK